MKKGKVLNMTSKNQGIFNPPTPIDNHILINGQDGTLADSGASNQNTSITGDDIQNKQDNSQYLPYFFLAGFVVVAYLVLKD